MRVAALIPVGPGHEKHAHDAVQSVIDAQHPVYWDVQAFTISDTDGELGRSKARNLLSQQAILAGFDWLFYLDADDLCTMDAFQWLKMALHDDPDLEALWGRIVRQRAWIGSDGGIQKLECFREDRCVAPLRTTDELLALPGHNTLRVGHFVKVDLFQRVGGWLEDWDVGEDHEFAYACAMHARKFAKIDEELAWIRTWLDGAHGPRGYVAGDPRLAGHYELGETIAAYWRARGPHPWSEFERELREEGRLYGIDRSHWGTRT